MQQPQINLPRVQRDVFVEALRGHSAKETARNLGMDVRAVDSARRRIMQKLLAKNMAHAIAKAFTAGMIKIEENALKCVGIFVIGTLLFGMDQEARTVRVLRGNTPIVRNIKAA